MHSRQEGYEVGSDHWGKGVRDMPHHSKRVEYDEDGNNSGVN
jgi:hypothetical protein